MTIIRPIIEPVVGPVALWPLAPVLGARADPGLVRAPTGFGWDPPFNIYRNGDGYTTDLDPTDYIVPDVTATYYLSPAGDDANDGLTPGSPKKSVALLLASLNAVPPASATLNLAAGVYPIADSDTLSFTFPVNLIGVGGKATLAKVIPVTWEPNPGYPGVWRSTENIGTNVRIGVDLSVLDTDGIPPRLKIVSSTAAVASEPGSLYVHSSLGVAAVHLQDGRAPDGQVMLFRGSGSVWNQSGACRVFARDVEFLGGGTPVILSSGSTKKEVFLDRCAIRYSRTGNGADVAADVESYWFAHHCDASYNLLDGFGYRGLIRVAEVDCLGVHNGDATTGAGDNNGSTLHGSSFAVRINGRYVHNGQRNVHDVNNSASWNLACEAGYAANRAGSPDPYNSANFMVGTRGLAAEAPRMFLQDCTSLGGSLCDAAALGGGIMDTLRCTGLDAKLIEDVGQIIDGGDVWPEGA